MQTGSSNTRLPWTQPGVLRLATYTSPNSLNPILTTNTAENFFASLAFDLLISLDARGQQVPVLARDIPTLANGGIGNGGRKIIYHLRPNVKWHDGVQFTSADVKFTWQAIMNPKNNVVSRRGYDLVTSVDTPDPYTVIFNFRNPFAPAVNTIFAESDEPYRILPKHTLANYSNINQVPFNSSPVGTGPFRFVKWQRGDHIEYAANERYFLGAPKLRKLIVRMISDDNTRVAQMRTHELDAAITISSAAYRDLRGVPNVRLVLPLRPVYNSLSFNLTHPPLDDIRVRRAIAYAINKEQITKNDTYGAARVATEDLSPFYTWAFEPNVQQYPYNPLKAGQLLDQAGWHAGPGAVRVKGGRALSLELVYGQGNPTAKTLGVQIQAALMRAGITAQIKTYDYALLYAAAQAGGILNSGKYDLALYSWVAGADPDNSSQWMCAFVPPHGNNFTHYCNKEMDAVQQTALTHFDQATRKTAYRRSQQLLARDVPAVFLYWPTERDAISPDFKNYAPNGISEGWNAYQWSN
ncbi:MAG: peptide ABC transporter substrate-binding protein [Candidatus Eremiobacteraeota bacterium]|nr:peptide ABC transporter substrate-binding protein [Candidatus Eremiobacteraeota bacterium]